MLERRLLGIGMLVALSAGAGCSQPHVVRLFDGGTLPKAAVATLWYMDGFRLHAVDDREEGFVHRCTRKDACVIELLPGSHTVRASYVEVKQVRGERGGITVALVSPPKTESFTVMAGKFYSLTANLEVGITEWERKHMVSTVFGGGDFHQMRGDDWTLKVEPSGDPDHPVQE